MESNTDEPTQSKLHRSEGGYRQAAPMQNLQAAPRQMHLSERRVMNHSEQIAAHVRIEAAQDLHDQLQAMRSGYAKLYGRARGILGVMAIHGDLDPVDALKELDDYKAELFPEDQEFAPARYYGEGRNE